MSFIRNRTLRFSCALPVLFVTAGACAQKETGVACPDAKNASSYQTFFLHHSSDRDSFMAIQTVLRNDLTEARINGALEQTAMAVCGTPAELELAQKIITDLDRPRKTWRLTFAFVQTGSVEHAAPQSVTLVVASGQRTQLKQGDRVPLVTGMTGTDAPSSQVQYVDVGLNLSATIAGDADSLELSAKIERSSLADEKSGIGTQDPTIHQTVLEITSRVVQGKPLMLGSLDNPAANRHEQVEVTVEPIS